MKPTITVRQWLLGYLRQFWPGSLIVAILSLIGTALQLLSPWPLKILIDSVFGSTPAPAILGHGLSHEQLLFEVTAIIVGLFILQNLFGIARAYITARIDFNCDFRVKSDVFAHILAIPGQTLGSQHSGDYLYRLSGETGSVSALIIDLSNSILQSIITIIGIVGILLWLNWRMALISLLVVPFLLVSIRLFTKRLAAISLKIEQNNSRVYDYTAESIQHTSLVQSFNRETDQLQSYQDRMLEGFRQNVKLVWMSGMFGLANETVATIAMIILVLFGGELVLHGHQTAGELIIFLNYLNYFYGPLQSLTSNIAGVRNSLVSAGRVVEILNNSAAPSQPANPVRLDRAKGQISLNNVSFSYANHLVLDGISLTIEPGEKVALIGPGGSGKSTLVSLLPRFYELDRGFIHLDGTELRQLDLHNLRDQFAIVDQEPVLFSGTIADNIAYALPPGVASTADIVAAAGAANAYDFIMKLPQQFNTDVGEGGGLLSGGQKQRIAIARAFLKNAPILLLDEPTSALDAESENAVIDAIERLMATKTAIIVSHRLAALKQINRIYELKSGHLTATTIAARTD